MQQTLSKVKNLKKFLQKYGDDTLLSGTISKMLDYQINKYNEKIKKLEKNLRKFERSYKKESSVFFKEFREGRLGDQMDFVEWSSLYEMRNRLMEKKAELEGTK